MNTRNLATRILSMLLVLVMVFGMVPMQAFAAENATVVDAAIIFSDLHTSNGNYKESAVKNIMTAFKNTGLPFTSVTSGGDAFSSNESSYTAYTDTITGYIRNVLGNSMPVNYVWSDHDRGALNNSTNKVGIDKTSRLIYGAGNDGVYGTADDGNYYIYALSMADLCTYDRYSTGFNYTASSNKRASNGYTSTVPQAIENFLADAAGLNKDRPLFIVSHQPLFDNRNDNGWAEDWCNAINEVANEMDVAFFYGHNHKYDSGSDYYYAKGSTMPVATRKFTNGKDWNFNYQVGSGWQYSNDLASVNKVLNFTHMCAGYLDPSSTGSTSNTTRQGTALAITIYEDSIRYTTYNANGIFTGSYAVDKTVTRDFAVSQPEEPVVPSEPAQTEPTAPSEPEATEPPVSDEVEGEKVYVLVDAPVDGGKYLIVNQTLTNGDLSKDWDADDNGMAVIRNGESISYSYAVPQAGTITDASGKVYTKGYIEYTDENAVWTVHASGNAWTIENDGYYLNKGSSNGVTASKTALTWNYTANGDDSRLYNGSDYLYFTYYSGDKGSWRWRTGTESGTSSTRDVFFYQEVVLNAPNPEPDPDPTPDFTPDSNDVVVGDGAHSYNKVTSSIQEGYYQLQNNHTSKYLTSTKTSNANRLNLDSNGQNHIWYIKPVSGGYTIQYGGPDGQYLTFSHEKAAMSSTAQTIQLVNTNGYWGIGATSGNPVPYLAREGTSSSSSSVHGYASNDYKYPTDVGMDWNLYQRIENRKTYSVSASDVHHYLGQNDNQVQLTYSLLVNGAAGTLPAGGSWSFSTAQDTDGIVKNISSKGVITFNEFEGSCYIKVAYTWSEGTAYMYVKVTAERDPNACEHKYTAVTVDATCTKDGSITYTCQCGDTYTEVIKATGHDYSSKVTAPTCTEAGYTTYTCHCGDTYVADKVAALGHNYKSVVTKPTCTTEGYTTYTCATCGHSYTADKVAATGHSYKTVTVDATCTENGSITYTCACGDTYTEVIAALGHDYEAVVTNPTCTKAGYTTYTCACGHSYVADQTAALGHTYKAKVTKPTCTEAGYTTYTCACGDSYVADQVAALGHAYKSVTVDATCTENGSITYTCTCGDTYAEVIEATGHDYTSVVTAPTCTEDGYTTHTCHCGHAYTDNVVKAHGHSYKSVVLAPTCIAEGYTTHTCTTCGHRYTSNHVAALGHSYESFTVAPTCTEDGSVTYTCHCGEYYVEVIKALGHDYSSVVTKPTCTEEGYTTYTCATCGHTHTGNKVAALGHKYESVTVKATCTENGSVTYTCACGDTYTEVIKATGHNYKTTVTKPTCTEEGYTTYSCACGDSYVADKTAALGHIYKSVTVKATCTTDGSITYTCACGDTYTEVIKATGHDYSSKVTAPTCTEAGYTTYTCACGDSYTADEVQALGHTYKSVVTKPTCTTEGYTTYTCAACGHTYTGNKVAALGHDHKAVVTAPTCTEAGYTTYTCACGDTYTADEVKALGHDYESVTVKATCTKDGSVTYTCHCGHSYVEVIKALGHDYESVVTAPTCTEEGFTTYTCHCGHSYTANKVAALGHDYESVTVKATCTTDGSITYTCHCGDTYVEVIKATGHDHKAAVTAPTCTEAGYTTYTCHCGDTYTADIVKALGHNYKSVTVKATCTVDGSVIYTCHCGDTYVEVIKAAGHDYKATVTAPTCTKDGYTTYTCHCGDTYTADVVKATGHDHEAVVTAPTCTKDGYTTYTCHCGDTYTADIVKALGHTYESVTVKATCTVDGSVTYTCHCGDSYVEVIKATGHDHKTTVTTPTCTTAGYTTYTCHCGNTYTADQVAALGHSYICTEGDGCLIYTCSVCGDTYTEIVSLEWVKVSGAYVLDTNGIDIGSNHKYIVVGANQNYALTVNNGSIGAASVTIQNNTINLSNASAYEFYFVSNNSKERNTYLLTQDGSKTVYHANGNMYYGNDNKGYWYFGSASNGSYQLYDKDGSSWYLNYGYVWGNNTTNRFAVSSTARTVRLFKYTDTYARLAGSIYQTCTDADNMTADAILKKLSIETSSNGSDVTGTTAVTASMVTWNTAFDGTTPGVYTATVTYEGVQIGTFKVTVTAKHTYNTVVVAPTCTAEGYTIHTCTVCGYSKTEARTAALGHSYTCTEGEGVLIYTCACGSSYSEAQTSEWMQLPGTYVLDTNGIDVGSNHKYIVAAADQDYIMTLEGDKINPTKVTIQNNTITLSNASKHEFYFVSNNAKERNTYLLTQDGSKSVYHVSTEIKYGHDNKGYWYFGSASNGAYQLYDYDNCNWYLNYGTAWGTDSVSRFSVTYNTRSVRLFKHTETYARLAGSIFQTGSQVNGMTAASVLNKLTIETSTNGSDVTGSIPVTADMVKWNTTFNGSVPGVYTATITYQGVELGTVKVNVTGTTVKEFTTEAATVYGRTTAISSGNDYVVTLYSDNQYYALSHAGNELSVVEISVSDDEITSEITEDLLWSFEGNKLSYKDEGTTYRLYGKRNDLSISTSKSSKITFKDNKLKLDTVYLQYSNGSPNANSSATTTYMFTAK